MAERINTSGATAKEIAQAIGEVLKGSESMSETTLKIKTDSSIYKAKEDIEGLTEALESYEKCINKNKNYSKTSYFTTEEKAVNRLKNAWEQYAKERNAGIINDNNLADSKSAKKVLIFANALEALTGKSNSISEISQEISDLVSQMRELPNFKNYNLDVSQFKEIFDVLKNIQKLYPDLSEITKPFKGLESTVETLTSLIDIQNTFTTSITSTTGAYDAQAKAVEEVTEQFKTLTEAEMEAKLKAEHNKGEVYDWQIDLDDELEDIQKYSKALDELKQNQKDALWGATYYQNEIAKGNNKESYTQWMKDSIQDYHKYTDQIEFVQEQLQKAIHTYTPTANGENGKELNALIVILKDLHEEIIKIRTAFVEVGNTNDSLTPIINTIDKINTAISDLSNSLKGINLNMNIEVGSNKEIEAKIQSKISLALQAYQKLFDELKLSGAGGSMINTNFFDFDINQYDTMMGKLKAYQKFIENMRKEAKLQYNGKDVLYNSIDKKYWTSASAAMGQVTKAFNELKTASNSDPLKDLFGKTDLTEVINQLKEISSFIEKGLTVDEVLNGKTTDTGNEVKGLEAIKQSVDSITNAVNEKTEAFKNEEANVTKIIPNETHYLGKLISALKIIKEQLDNIAKFSGIDLNNKIKVPNVEINRGKIAEAATNISDDPKEAIKHKTRNVTKADNSMTTAQLIARTESLEKATAQLESDLTAQGSTIKEITEFYDSQDNLVKTVLKEQQELDGLLKNTTWTTNYDLKNNTSFSSHIDSTRYEDIEKKMAKERSEQAKRFANEEKREKDKLTKESYNIEKKYISEIYSLKEKNAKAKETNSKTQKEDIAYNNMLIASYEELISDEKEYRNEKGLVNDNRNQEYELRLIAEYEARREAYNASLKESIKLAEQEAYAENAKRKQKENAEISTNLLKKQKEEYEKICQIKLAISKLDPQKNSEEIATLKAQEKQHINNYNASKKELEVYQDIIDRQKQSNELFAIKNKYQEKIDNIIASKNDSKRNAEISTNNSTKKIDEISEAYKGLIKTEKSYQELQAKSQFTSLTPQETKNLQELINNREKYNQVLKTTTVLTEKQLQTQKEYTAKQEEVQMNLGSYKDLTATEHNQDAIKAYKTLLKQSKDYYILKSNEDSLIPQEKILLEQLEKEWEEAYLAKGKYATVNLGNSNIKAELESIRQVFQNGESKAYEQSVKNYANNMYKKYERLYTNKKDFKYVDAYYEKMDLLESKIKELQSYDLINIDETKLNYVKKLEQEIDKLYNEVNSQTKNFAFQLAKPEEIRDTMSKIRKTLADNTAMPSSLKQLFYALEKKYQLLIDTKGTEKQFRELNEELADLNYQLQKSGKTGDSFFTSIAKRTKSITTSFISMYLSMYDIIRYGREVFEIIKEYDNNLAEMNKVSEYSIQTLKNFQKESFELANSVGTTASTIQSSTADFMRLGESLNDAKKSAQDANTLFQVSEFESINEATDALVAMSSAYNDLEKSQINDVLNEVGKIMPKHTVMYGDIFNHY